MLNFPTRSHSFRMNELLRAPTRRLSEPKLAREPLSGDDAAARGVVATSRNNNDNDDNDNDNDKKMLRSTQRIVIGVLVQPTHPRF